MCLLFLVVCMVLVLLFCCDVFGLLTRRRALPRPRPKPTGLVRPAISHKCTSKVIGRQGIELKHRNSLQKSLCPVVICPYLCSSESPTGPPNGTRKTHETPADLITIICFINLTNN